MGAYWSRARANKPRGMARRALACEDVLDHVVSFLGFVSYEYTGLVDRRCDSDAMSASVSQAWRAAWLRRAAGLLRPVKTISYECYRAAALQGPLFANRVWLVKSSGNGALGKMGKKLLMYTDSGDQIVEYDWDLWEDWKAAKLHEGLFYGIDDDAVVCFDMDGNEKFCWDEFEDLDPRDIGFFGSCIFILLNDQLMVVCTERLRPELEPFVGCFADGLRDPSCLVVDMLANTVYIADRGHEAIKAYKITVDEATGVVRGELINQVVVHLSPITCDSKLAVGGEKLYLINGFNVMEVYALPSLRKIQDVTLRNMPVDVSFNGRVWVTQEYGDRTPTECTIFAPYPDLL